MQIRGYSYKTQNKNKQKCPNNRFLFDFVLYLFVLVDSYKFNE